MTDLPLYPNMGYKADGSAWIFQLPPGAPLPEGWSPDPNVISDPAKRSAEAISAALEGRTYAPPAPSFNVVGPSEVETLRARVAELEADKARLEDVIKAGTAENEKLVAENNALEEELTAAATEMVALKEQQAPPTKAAVKR